MDGNAAIHYLKAIGFVEEDYARKSIHELLTKAKEEAEREGKPFEWPPGTDTQAAALPLPEVRELLALHGFQVPLLAEAARRRHCDWDRRIADSDMPLGILIPEITESRHLARVESLRCRLAIAEGRIDDALAILRRQFMLARHLGQDEFAVGVVNGVHVACTATRDALELTQLPAAPNLYWAWAAMPRPFIDASRMLATGRSMFYLVMKSLRDVDETPRPVEYWQAFIDRDPRAFVRAIEFNGDPYDSLPSFSGDCGKPEEIFRLRAAGFVAAAYPGARLYLAEECGLPAERFSR